MQTKREQKTEKIYYCQQTFLERKVNKRILQAKEKLCQSEPAKRKSIREGINKVKYYFSFSSKM